MTTFDDRERAFEAKFARDAEMQFRAVARRTILAGHWAAGLQGLKGEAAESYAQDLLHIDFEEPGSEGALNRLVADLQGQRSRPEIEAKLAGFLAEAKAQILGEPEAA